MDKVFDVIIIGAGPAGMTAAIYAKRAELSVLLIDRSPIYGGQVLNTYEVDNYPGLNGISGIDLAGKFSEHVDKFGVEKRECEVISVDLENEIKSVSTDMGDYLARTVVLCGGNSPRKLMIPGEEELAGMGVSYCATCDGAFFRKKVTAVIGGGDVAVEDAIFLARGCSKVYLIHRRDELRAAKSLQTAAFNNEKIEIIFDTVPLEIVGIDNVRALKIKNVKSGECDEIVLDGVFVAVGNEPNTSYINGSQSSNDKLETDDRGYIVASEDCKTSIPGVFVAGDLRTKRLRQISTAVGDGANAITSVQDYLNEK